MSTIEAPPQHITALQRANKVRLARAELKRDVSEGFVTVAHILENVPWMAETMTVYDLLASQHRWGRSRTRRLLASVGILEGKQIGTLTDRQRDELADRLGR